MKKRIKMFKKGKRVPYFAYGSNLDLRGMSERTPTAERGPAATLKGWKLTFRGVADIERSPDSEAVGGLWFLDQAGLEALDTYEGYPYMYDRVWVDVQTEHAKVRAITYVMTDQRPGSVMMPSPYYLNVIMDGFHAFGLDMDVLAKSLSEVYDEVDKRVGVDNLIADGKRMRAPSKKLDTSGMSPATRRMYDLEEQYDKYGYKDTDESWLADTVWDVRCSGISEDRVMDIVMEVLDEFRGTEPDADAEEDELFIPSGVRVA